MNDTNTCNLAVIQKCVPHLKNYDGHPVPPHPNVIFLKCHGKVNRAEESEEEFCTISNLHQTLDDFIDDHGNEKIVKIVLLQLAHALNHIHENGLSHGQITLKMIYVSKTRNVVLAHSGEIQKDRIATESAKTGDIKELRKVFDSVLKMNSQGKIQGNDVNVAEDLLRVMKDGQITSNEILLHPYFWDEERKLCFLSKITQFSKAGNAGKPTKDALNQKSSDVFDTEGWKVMLQITDNAELGEYNGNLKDRLTENKKKKKGKHRTVGSSTIKDFSDEVNKAKKEQGIDELMYNKNELQSLLNFIRNRWEHFWEDSLEVQACFGYDHNAGYWKFFSRRFKKLFMVVYYVAKEQMDKRAEPGIKDVYFKTITENKKLPKLEHNEAKEGEPMEEG